MGTITKNSAVICVLALSLGLLACGDGGGGNRAGATPEADAPADPSGLTAEQLEKGIGPVTNLELGPLDAELAAEGEAAYNLKCTACHKLEERFIGPPLADVTERRTPEFIMNMMLNPVEMTQKHPEAKKLLAEYIAPMADQSLSHEESRAILEYLRHAAQ